jgi:collagenase-like PrtC family protease
MEDLKRLVDLGPHSLRIEARLSSDEEFVQTVQLYRQALDQLAIGQEPDLHGYTEQLALFGTEFTKGHYYRGVL